MPVVLDAGTAHACGRRMRRAAALSFAALTGMTVAVNGAAAQNTLGSERRDFNRLRGDVWSAWTAITHPDQSAAIPVVAIAAAFAAVVPHDSAIHMWMTRNEGAPLMRLIGPFREH